jgi:hypothetical protein
MIDGFGVSCKVSSGLLRTALFLRKSASAGCELGIWELEGISPPALVCACPGVVIRSIAVDDRKRIDSRSWLND